jgi:arylsulfatase A-like enzyme
VVRRTIQSDPVYAAMIRRVDENIGRLMAALDGLGKRDDTLVIFTSDNGGLATSEGSPTCNAPLSEGKGWMYEGGTREPLLVCWPGRIPGGSLCPTPVTSTDFFPTLLDAAGMDLLPEKHCDGVSILPLLRGDPGPERSPIFWHFPHYANQGGTPGASVRDGDWKLIRFFEDGHEELYHLKEDEGETRNRAAEEPAERAKLSEKLTAWQEEVEAAIPESNPDYVPWEGRGLCGHFPRTGGAMS